ncbi:hypothetical protein TIFTF001_024787 [Ficus carica]|uniref:Uncharacterized protein n=1 Tax=Ficus carica TaxID=3494 RepID=A0AA88AMN6_FICCA|nr:hypothetical protein TIFTF001_024787 [Ficus carica]
MGFATFIETYCELKLEIRVERSRLSPLRGLVAVTWSRSVSPMAPSGDPVAEVPQVPEDIAILKTKKEGKERRKKDRGIRMMGGEKFRPKIRKGKIENK